MTVMIAAEKTELDTPKNKLSELQELLKTQKQEIDVLKERIAWFERQVFGQRSERVIGSESSEVVYLPGLEPDKITPPAETTKIPPHERKKRKRKKKNDYTNGLIIPEGLPVEQVILDLPEEEKVCLETGEELVRIGEEVTRKLAYRSAHFFVKEFVRPKYAFPSNEEAGITIADLPDAILPKSRADESLLAEIITKKFADHTPLYRLSEIYSRDDVQITRQLLSQWIIRLGTTLYPLYELMLKQIKDSGNAFIDETPVKLQVKGKGKLQQGYMWTLVGGEGANPPHRVYWFCENRNYQHAYDLIKGFSGSLHSDKYGAYQNLAKKDEIDWHPCWVHIRRYFEEAKSGDLKLREAFLRKVRHLFMLERVAWARSPEERLRIRKEKEEPIIDELIKLVKDKLETGKLLPKSNFSKALNYFYGLTSCVKNYLTKPYARMDNNVAERAIRPLAIGRKNWLFIGSMKGGQATSVLLSLVQTCRGLGINPRVYLEDIMCRFQSHPANRLEELIPNRWAQDREQKLIVTKPLHLR